MGADNNTVAGLQADQGLEDSSGSRVRGRNHGSHHTDGLRDLLHAAGFVFFNHTAGLGVPVGVVDILAGIVVFDHFVFHHAHAGFLNSHPCQGNAGLVGGGCRCQENPVHLLLGVGGVLALCFPHPGDGSLQCFGAVHCFIGLLIHVNPPPLFHWTCLLRSSGRQGITRCFHASPSRNPAPGSVRKQS